jgi:hypothetical protein
MNLNTIIEDFNDSTLELLSIIEETVKNTDSFVLFKTAKKKINIIMNADPVFMLDSGGAYLYKYRDVITKGDFDDFILNTEKYIQEDDMKDLKTQSSSSSKDEVNSAESIIKYLREKWTDYSLKEKKIIKRLVKNMLSNNCKYKMYLVQTN